MNWKEFLKPNRRKNFVFTLMAVGFIIGLIHLFDLLNFLPVGIKVTIVLIFFFMLSFPYAICTLGIPPFCLNDDPLAFLLFDVPVLFVTAAFWWIISCLIIFLYDEFKYRK